MLAGQLRQAVRAVGDDVLVFSVREREGAVVVGATNDAARALLASRAGPAARDSIEALAEISRVGGRPVRLRTLALCATEDGFRSLRAAHHMACTPHDDLATTLRKIAREDALAFVDSARQPSQLHLGPDATLAVLQAWKGQGHLVPPDQALLTAYVMRHELEHIALGYNGPRWLVEAAADEIAWRSPEIQQTARAIGLRVDLGRRRELMPSAGYAGLHGSYHRWLAYAGQPHVARAAERRAMFGSPKADMAQTLAGLVRERQRITDPQGNLVKRVSDEMYFTGQGGDLRASDGWFSPPMRSNGYAHLKLPEAMAWA